MSLGLFRQSICQSMMVKKVSDFSRFIEFSLGLKNPLRILFKKHTQEPSPYVVVRKNLEGLIDRKTFYRLIEKSDFHSHKGASWLGIWSQNVFFPILEENKLNILD